MLSNIAKQLVCHKSLSVILAKSYSLSLIFLFVCSFFFISACFVFYFRFSSTPTVECLHNRLTLACFLDSSFSLTLLPELYNKSIYYIYFYILYIYIYFYIFYIYISIYYIYRNIFVYPRLFALSVSPLIL